MHSRPSRKRFYVVRELDDLAAPSRWSYVVYDRQGNGSTWWHTRQEAELEARRMNQAVDEGRV